MKYVISGNLLAAVAFMVIAAMMVSSGRNIRKNELEKTLDYAIEQAIKPLIRNKSAQITEEICLETLKRNMLTGLESDSDITVSIMGIDVEKGILSVQAEEKFKNPLGKSESIQAERTIVLENYNLGEKGLYTITYKVDNAVYKEYTLKEGSCLPIPVKPTENFQCWLDEAGKIVNFSDMVANSNRVFQAKIN